MQRDCFSDLPGSSFANLFQFWFLLTKIEFRNCYGLNVTVSGSVRNARMGIRNTCNGPAGQDCNGSARRSNSNDLSIRRISSAKDHKNLNWS